MNPIVLIARKEAGELLLSGRGLGWLLALAGVLSVFSLLLVSNLELSLLDNAQVVYDMAGTITALGALLAIIVGTDTIAGERERGSLLPLILAPISRQAILLGKVSGQIIAWFVSLVIALFYLWAVGSTGQNLVEASVGLVLFGTPVVVGFGLFAMGLGARLASTRSSLLTGLIVLLLAASPLLLGPSLRQSAIGQIFDAVNPYSNALNAFDLIIIDSKPIFAQVGHWAVTLAWLGLAFWFAWSSFRRAPA